MTENIRIEIGGGRCPLPGYTQYGYPGDGAEHECRWGYERLPIPDFHADEVYASHVIEHIPWWDSGYAISDVYRILKMGGALELHTVNFEYLVQQYLKGAAADQWQARGKNPHLHPFLSIASRIFCVGDMPEDPNWHRAVFDRPHLTSLFERAGFTGITYPIAPKGKEKHGPINMGIRGMKA